MEIHELAARIGAHILTNGLPAGVDIRRVYAGDRISDLLNHAGADTLLVSNLACGQLMRLAELMDVPGLCIVNDCRPDGNVLQMANSHGTLIMSSPVGMFETCGRIYKAADWLTR